jgi:hypothetical protein
VEASARSEAMFTLVHLHDASSLMDANALVKQEAANGAKPCEGAIGTRPATGHTTGGQDSPRLRHSHDS